MTDINYDEKIPNNVDLSTRQARCSARSSSGSRASSTGGRRSGPTVFQNNDIYLRTATSRRRARAGPHFGNVKMPDYRWGIFLAEPGRTARSASATTSASRRGRSCRASIAPRCAASSSPRATPSRPPSSSSALLGHTAPVALRPAQPLPGERRGRPPSLGDGLPAPRLLRPRRPRGGRGAARSAAPATPTSRASSATFNEPINDWLSFFMFTFFTDRDGKFQLLALAESGFDPLARTSRFMLTEEAHHMFVGETGVGRIVQRTVELMNELGTDDPRTSARAGRHRPADHPEVPELLVQLVARPLRRRDLVERRDASSPTASRAAPRRSSTRTTRARRRATRWTCRTAAAA